MELLIVLGIIGVLSAALVPSFRGKSPRYEREQFIARFNTLIQYGWQQALVTHKVHRITVDVGKKLISLTVHSDEKDKSGEGVYKPLTNPVQETECIILDQINIKQFFIEGFDMVAKFSRNKIATMWFYIIPEGMVQSVVMNFNDTKDVRDDQPRPVGMVLNPFSAQFKVYDAFQKP